MRRGRIPPGRYEVAVVKPVRLAVWKNMKVIQAAVDFQEAIAAVHRRSHPNLFEECADLLCADTRRVVRSIIDDLNGAER